MAKTLYDILGIAESADEVQIHQAYKQVELKLQGRYDSESAAMLNRAREAFVVLGAPAKRIAYDRKLAEGRLDSLQSVSVAVHRPPVWQRPVVLMSLVTLVGLLIYWQIETSRLQQIEAQRVANETAAVAAENAYRNAMVQQERQRLELAERQLAELNEQNRRTVAVTERQADVAARGQELEQRYLQPRLDRELERERKQYVKQDILDKQQQNLAMQSQSLQIQQQALQQREQGITAIRDYQRARIREMDRDSGIGSIYQANPALEP